MHVSVYQIAAMRDSIYATGLPFSGKPDLPATLKDLAALLPACAGVRRWGTASLDLTYVAAGRYDGFWERDLNIWDTAAGIIIAREAGAIVEGIDPAISAEQSGDVICASGVQFDTFAKLIRAS